MNTPTPRERCPECGDSWTQPYYSGDCPDPFHGPATPAAEPNYKYSGANADTARKIAGDANPQPEPTLAEHEHGEDCKTVMAIRNTDIDTGVELLAKYTRQERRAAVNAELKWLRDNASGGGDWRRLIEQRIDR